MLASLLSFIKKVSKAIDTFKEAHNDYVAPVLQISEEERHRREKQMKEQVAWEKEQEDPVVGIVFACLIVLAFTFI